MRAIKIIGIAVAAVVVLLALAMTVGIPSGFLASGIQSQIERETGYRLTIAGTTKVSLWPSLKLTFNELTLQDPDDQSGIRRITADSLEADMPLSSAWSGQRQVNELILTRPVLYLPLLRERLPSTNPPKPVTAASTTHIDRVKINDGALAFSTTRDRVEGRIEAINAEVVASSFTGTARAGERAIKFDVKANTPTEQQRIRIEFSIQMPGTLEGPVSGKAEASLNGAVVMINGLSGMVSDGAFSGSASIDIASKPLVTLDLDFQRLNIPLTESADNSITEPWSDAPIDVSWLNYVDAQARVSVTEANIGKSRFAPIVLQAQLAQGLLKADVSNLGAYGGQISGKVMLDASSGSPSFSIHSDLVGVRARSLLTNLAGFDEIDGKLQAKLALRSVGGSQRALMSNLAGMVFANFQDGAIRSINIAQMMRSLTSGTLSGWQQSDELSTNLSQLSASFRVDKGQAVTTDLNLIGPLVKMTGAGTIDLGTKMMAFRVEPKLVLTTEGQGRKGDPVGFGIPVMVEGSWAAPRIYPDMAGVLDHPEAAYAKLREMGKGLFGPDGAGLDSILDSLGLGRPNGAQPQQSPSGTPDGTLGEAIGNLIQQGLRNNNTSQGRSMPVTPGNTTPQAAPPPPRPDNPPPTPQDSPPMNDVMRQLFNR